MIYYHIYSFFIDMICFANNLSIFTSSFLRFVLLICNALIRLFNRIYVILLVAVPRVIESQLIFPPIFFLFVVQFRILIFISLNSLILFSAVSNLLLIPCDEFLFQTYFSVLGFPFGFLLKSFHVTLKRQHFFPLYIFSYTIFTIFVC